MFHYLLCHLSKVEFVYQTTILILSVGMMVSALEDIHTRIIFQSNGLLSWKVSRLIDKWYASGFILNKINHLLNDKCFLLGFYIRLFLSIVLFWMSLDMIFSPLLLFLMFFLLMLVALRSPYGLDGSYQMYLIILLGLSIGTTFGIYSSTGLFCLWFISAQLVLCYFISGISKLSSRFWRKGYALNMIFSTKIYGHPFIYKIVSRNTIVSSVLCWMVMLFEVLFFCIFFFNSEYAIFFVAAGFSFHLANAIFMGLNDFFLAFSAAYPALLYFVITKKPIYFLNECF